MNCRTQAEEYGALFFFWPTKPYQSVNPALLLNSAVAVHATSSASQKQKTITQVNSTVNALTTPVLSLDCLLAGYVKGMGPQDFVVHKPDGTLTNPQADQESTMFYFHIKRYY